MDCYSIKKEDIRKAFTSSKHEIIAPVKKGNIHVFSKINDPAEIDLDYINTQYSPTKFFLPNEEKIFDFRGLDMKENKDETTRIIIGIRPCDVHALFVLDKIYLDDVKDIYYRSRRDNTLIVAFACSKTGENCFCESLETDRLESGFDLLFYENKDTYIIKVGTQKGKELLKDHLTEIETYVGSQPHCKKALDLKKVANLKNLDSDSSWEEAADICLSCAACTTTCPTCGCFNVRDFVNLDLASGTRKRINASCQLKNYSEVAGGHIFRDSRISRFKHRIYHKFDYFKEQYDMFMCVGCGRCITNCPANIDMVKIINGLK